MKKKNDIYNFMVGTYTNNKQSKGIYFYKLDKTTAQLDLLNVVETENPSFLAVDHEKDILYVVNEIMQFAGEKTGTVSSFRIDEDQSEFIFLNSQPTGGTGPCYLSFDKTKNHLLVTNYMGGNIAILPVLTNGKIGETVTLANHSGSSVNSSRQSEPHPHSIINTPDGNYLLVADLGIDKIMVYEYDYNSGDIKLSDELSYNMSPGSGPRHLLIDPAGKYLYVTNELDSTVSVFTINKDDKELLCEIQHISSLPDDFTGDNTGADLHFHPSGKFLYASNRGHDSLVIYDVDEKTGLLKVVDHCRTEGQGPRNFSISPDGEILIVANQMSNNLVVFAIDEKSGILQKKSEQKEIMAPVFVKIL